MFMTRPLIMEALGCPWFCSSKFLSKSELTFATAVVLQFQFG